jgi:hypothetical protein
MIKEKKGVITPCENLLYSYVFTAVDFAEVKSIFNSWQT